MYIFYIFGFVKFKESNDYKYKFLNIIISLDYILYIITSDKFLFLK